MRIKYEPYQAKSILYRKEEIDTLYGARYTLNPYRGCAVGCRYCFVQEKKFIESKGFEEKKDMMVQIKINAPFLLRQKLNAGLEPEMIVLGESCEPYSNIEDKYFITQRLLEILTDYNFPLHIITRYDRVLRDIDLIKRINKRNYACISVSVPAVTGDLVEKLDGESPAIRKRFKLVKTLNRLGIDAGISLSPVIPYITDTAEMRRVVKKAAEYGSKYIISAPMVIKPYQKLMFYEWLEEKDSDLPERYSLLYGDREIVDESYWSRFYRIFSQTAAAAGVPVGIPFHRNSERYQEMFKFNESYA